MIAQQHTAHIHQRGADGLYPSKLSTFIPSLSLTLRGKKGDLLSFLSLAVTLWGVAGCDEGPGADGSTEVLDGVAVVAGGGEDGIHEVDASEALETAGAS